MDARAMDMNVCLTRTRQQRTGAARQRASGQIGPHVEAEDAIHPVALEHAALAHRLGTTSRLLGRLKHKEHVALNGARLLTDRTVDKGCRRKRHGHVSIVAASMHLAGMGRSERCPVASAMGSASISARIAVACTAPTPASKKAQMQLGHGWVTSQASGANTPSI